MTSFRVREEPWKSQSVCTTLPTMVSPKLAVQFCNPHQLTRHRFRFKKHALPHLTPFNACHHTHFGKPCDVSRFLHLTFSRVFNTYRPSQWKNPSFCIITTWMQNPNTSSTSPSSSQSTHTPSLPTPFRKASYHHTKHICLPILSRMRLARNTPHAILYGPSPSAELAFDRSTTSKDRPRWN
jgi:hypothetical protein